MIGEHFYRFLIVGVTSPLHSLTGSESGHPFPKIQAVPKIRGDTRTARVGQHVLAGEWSFGLRGAQWVIAGTSYTFTCAERVAGR